MLFVQEMLKLYRNNNARQPHVHMNVVPRSTWNTNEVQIKVLIKAVNDPLGVSPSKGNQPKNRPRLSLSDLVAQSAE